MFEIALPFPDNEQHFWQTVAYRWVEAPGLLLAVVPADLNTYRTGRWLRDHICRPPLDSSIMAGHLGPDPRHTYFYDLTTDDTLRHMAGAACLPELLAETGQLEPAERAARGETPFYLLIAGLAIAAEVSIDGWVRQVVETWPGSSPSAPSSRLHVCCIATTPLPARQACLPDGYAWLIPQPDPEEEILRVVQDTVTEQWPVDDPYLSQYICASLADMASGRRTHAEWACATIEHDWALGRATKSNWRPHWKTRAPLVQQAKEILAQAGIASLENLHTLNGHNSRGYTDEAELARRLWAHGLWTNRLENRLSLWPGLTSLAKAALKPAGSKRSLLPLCHPHATTHILSRCLRIEQQIKHLLWYLLESSSGRKHIRAALDSPVRQSSRVSLRKDIVEKMPHRFEHIPPKKRHNDEVVISACSFGALNDILFALAPSGEHQALCQAVDNLVDIRNAAAHGEWFTAAQFTNACRRADEAEAALSYFKPGKS
jgi:hypothetical protein